jgi:hypothetical protein
MPPLFTPQDLLGLALEVERGEAPRKLVQYFERLVKERTFQIARDDRAGRLEEAAGEPGYLVTSSGRWSVYVPWPLAFAFPGPELLDELVDVIERVILRGRGNAVLSGSTTFAGRIAALGDIDLAQYMFGGAPALPAGVKDLVSRNNSAILVRVKWGRRYRRPWKKLLEDLDQRLDPGLDRLRLNRVLRKSMKFDFVDAETPFGLMPVSNIVLPSVAGDRRRGAARKSFVFQEAVLVAAGGPPWPLLMAGELLRYMKFLVRETKKYRDDKPIKALKRALSLSRLLGLDLLGQQAEAALAGDAASMVAGDSSISELDELWADLPADERDTLAPKLKEKRQKVVTLTERGGKKAEPRRIIDAVLDEIDDMLSSEGRSLDAWAKK